MPTRLIKRLTGWFLIVGGLAMIGAALWFGNDSLDALRHGARAPGVVIEVIGERGARGMTLYHPVVRFRPAGRAGSIVFKARPGMWPSPFDVDDRVTVIYDRNNPDDARIVSFWMLWLLPLAIALLGAACVFAGRDTLRKIV